VAAEQVSTDKAVTVLAVTQDTHIRLVLADKAAQAEPAEIQASLGVTGQVTDIAVAETTVVVAVAVAHHTAAVGAVVAQLGLFGVQVEAFRAQVPAINNIRNGEKFNANIYTSKQRRSSYF